MWICDISNSDDNGDSNELARSTYDALEPGQPDMCFELRTALYECFAQRTCAELDVWAGASDPMARCQAEFDALVPHIEVCGL